MPKLNHLVITALKDTNIVTAKKKIKYVDLALSNADDAKLYRPEGQQDYDEQEHGIHLVAEQVIEIDVTEKQLDAFRAAVARGEIECDGLPPAPVAVAAKASK